MSLSPPLCLSPGDIIPKAILGPPQKPCRSFRGSGPPAQTQPVPGTRSPLNNPVYKEVFSFASTQTQPRRGSGAAGLQRADSCPARPGTRGFSRPVASRLPRWVAHLPSKADSAGGSLGTAEPQGLGWALCLPGSSGAWGQEGCQPPPGHFPPWATSDPRLATAAEPGGDTAATELCHLQPKQPWQWGTEGHTHRPSCPGEWARPRADTARFTVIPAGGNRTSGTEPAPTPPGDPSPGSWAQGSALPGASRAPRSTCWGSPRAPSRDSPGGAPSHPATAGGHL